VTSTSFDSDEEVRAKYPTFAQIHDELSALTPPVPIHHSIDATKLGSYKALRSAEEREGGWDTIAFMFPHTGGLSTDVNRQVRANQALLIGFFNSCISSHKDRPFLRDGGRVLVCLFEGDPYTLWNIKDLARHAGLKVLESYKFASEDYPGYAHVRTLGAIEGGGAWKGEDRKARMYMFEKVGEKKKVENKKNKEKKRARDKNESDSDEG
jgi:25S rRNA (uracil2634-N3)-methyltransferase